MDFYRRFSKNKFKIYYDHHVVSYGGIRQKNGVVNFGDFF